jgi:hypothetical protein
LRAVGFHRRGVKNGAVRPAGERQTREDLAVLGADTPATVNGCLLVWSPGNWNITFYVSAAIYLVAVMLWKFLDPVTPLLQTDDPNAALLTP